MVRALLVPLCALALGVAPASAAPTAAQVALEARPVRVAAGGTRPVHAGQDAPPTGGAPAPLADSPGAPGGGTSNDAPPSAAPATPPAPGITLGTASLSDTPLRHPWIAWWEVAKGAYVLPKEHVQTGGVTTGSADYFLGQGAADARPPEARGVPAARIATEIAPVLLAELSRDGGPEPVAEALLALGRCAPALDAQAFAPVLSALEHHALHASNRTVAEAAVIALGLSAQDAAAPVLARILEVDAAGRSHSNEGPARARAFAAYGLALVARASEREDVRRYAVTALWRALDRSDRGEADVPTAAVLGLGLVPLARLVVEDAAGVPEPPSASRIAIARELGSALAQRRGARHEVRAHVPLALARMARDLPAERVEELKAWLAEPLLERAESNRRENPDLTQALALALGALADSDADPLDARLRAALLGLADNGDVATRNEALLAIAEVAARRGQGSLPGSATEALGKRLVQEVERGRGFSRPFAMSALGIAARGLRDQGFTVPAAWSAALVRGLDTARTPEELVAACVAIALAREASLVGMVQEAFERAPAGWPRAQVALALGLLGSSSSSPRLRELAAQSTQLPRDLRAAAEALFLTGDASHAEEMIRALRGAPTSQAQALAYALGAIGEPRAVDALLALLRGPSVSSSTRAVASQALGRIADPRTRSPLQELAEVVVPNAAPAALFGRDALEASIEDSPLPSAFLRGGGLLNLLP